MRSFFLSSPLSPFRDGISRRNLRPRQLHAGQEDGSASIPMHHPLPESQYQQWPADQVCPDLPVPSQPSSGEPMKDFDAEWNYRVVKSTGSGTIPAGITKKPDG